MPRSGFEGQRILVTGASGFIGSHLCLRLKDQCGEVHAFSRKWQLDDFGGLRWWQGDLAELETVKDLLQTIKPDIIFHLASHVQGSRSLEQVVPTFRSNLMAQVNVFTAASDIGCKRIVTIGSLEEPEPTEAGAIPASPYAVAKWAAGAYARMFHALYQLPVVIARVFMVYGPMQQDLKKLIPYVTLCLLQDQVPRLSIGKRLVDWIYVKDVVDGLLTIAETPDVEGFTIELGSGCLVPIRTVVEQLSDIINPGIKPLFGVLPDRPMEQVRVADTARTLSTIGWKPATPLKDGLRFTVDWYRELLKQGEIDFQ